jgi:hypothetical protein
LRGAGGCVPLTDPSEPSEQELEAEARGAGPDREGDDERSDGNGRDGRSGGKGAPLDINEILVRVSPAYFTEQAAVPDDEIPF